MASLAENCNHVGVQACGPCRAVAANSFDESTDAAQSADGDVNVHEDLATGLAGTDSQKRRQCRVATPNHVGISAVGCCAASTEIAHQPRTMSKTPNMMVTFAMSDPPIRCMARITVSGR